MLVAYGRVSKRVRYCRSGSVAQLVSTPYSGFLIFIAGILTYTWARQERPVAIVTTIAAVVSIRSLHGMFSPAHWLPLVILVWTILHVPVLRAL